MKRVRRVFSLGICNPLVRVAVWLVGCASLSLAALVAGAGLAVTLGAVYTAGVISNLNEEP